MTERLRILLKRLLFFPPVLVGVAVVAYQLATRAPPQQAEPAEIPRPVRVIQVEPVNFVPRALGYGFVQPGKVWEAVAEVAGKIVNRHPDLERGRLLPAATEILRIDPADYELAVRRLEASQSSVEAKLAEIAVRKSNIGNSLSIEQRALDLSRQDLTRKRALLAKGNVSQAAVDQAEEDVLDQQQRAQELENSLALVPAERRVLEADLDLAVAQLHEARLDLERTTIRLPFEGRVADVSVEETEFVNVGQTIAVIDSIDVAEVTAQVAIDRMPPLVPGGVDVSNMTAEDLSTFPRRWGLASEVRLASGSLSAAWPARFDRISDTIDPQTRTIGIIVAVDEPYRMAIPGERPPLTKNMYVEVEIRGPVQPGRVVIPRVAVHRRPGESARVYLAGPDDRLVARPVKLGPEQGDLVVVDSGLEPGERLVISDLIPAIEGMLLAPTADPETAKWLGAQAEGRSALR
jgi:RND family efflux transporter MFP subunit